jgi:hypothetical protein
MALYIRSLLSLLGGVRGYSSLAGFIPIGMGQVVTHRLRLDNHESPTPIPLFTQPRLAGHDTLPFSCLGKSGKPRTKIEDCAC